MFKTFGNLRLRDFTVKVLRTAANNRNDRTTKLILYADGSGHFENSSDEILFTFHNINDVHFDPRHLPFTEDYDN